MRMASAGPLSSQITETRSMVMVRMTNGNNATDSPGSKLSLLEKTVITARNRMTNITMAPSRATSSSFK